MNVFFATFNERRENSLVRLTLAIALMIACSRIKIPLFYVPITLQTLAVYMISISMRPKEAFASVLGYLAIGCFGIPVWAHSGASLFTGATAGYLFGMLIAAPLISFMIKKGISQIISCVAGSLLIKSFGVLWLLNLMDLKSAILCGFVPFIIPAIFKIFAAISFSSILRKN